MMTSCRHLVVIGIRYTCTGLRHKRLYRGGRMLHCVPGEQGSGPGPSMFFLLLLLLFFLVFMDQLQ